MFTLNTFLHLYSTSPFGGTVWTTVCMITFMSQQFSLYLYNWLWIVCASGMDASGICLCIAACVHSCLYVHYGCRCVQLPAWTAACVYSCLRVQLPACTAACVNSCLREQLPACTAACVYSCLRVQLLVCTAAGVYSCRRAQLYTAAGVHSFRSVHCLYYQFVLLPVCRASGALSPCVHCTTALSVYTFDLRFHCLKTVLVFLSVCTECVLLPVCTLYSCLCVLPTVRK